MTEQGYILIAALFGSIVGPLVLLLINKVFNRPKDDASLVGDMQLIAQRAVDDLRKERENNAAMEEHRQKEMKIIRERMLALEAAAHGPFRLTLEFTTSPLSILVQRLEVLTPQETKL